MNYILFDDPGARTSLLPLTYLRPVSGIRVGILTIYEKWVKALGVRPSVYTVDYLGGKYPLRTTEDDLYISGSICPEGELVKEIQGLEKGEALCIGDRVLAIRDKRFDPFNLPLSGLSGVHIKAWPHEPILIERPWHIFKNNAAEIRKDFALITEGRKSAGITDPATVVYNPEAVFVEDGASVKAAVIDAENGPVYLGRDSIIHPGSIVRGSFALLEHSQLSMGSKMRGDTTIGPFCKVGGEVTNSVIFGNTAKGHEGYLGNSVIAEWCNLGADTNTSNMRNDYGNIRSWDYTSETMQDTGLSFFGLVMGDHSKTGINTMFNSGTSVGVACNIYGAGYPDNFIPSFFKGGKERGGEWALERVLEMVERILYRREIEFGHEDREIMGKVFELTARYRKD